MKKSYCEPDHEHEPIPVSGFSMHKDTPKALDKMFTGRGVTESAESGSPIGWVRQVYRCGKAQVYVSPTISPLVRWWWVARGWFRLEPNRCGDAYCRKCYPVQGEKA
jgi:hypothetical protein